MEKNIDILLVKYFDNRTTKGEVLELQMWASKNKRAFKQAVQVHTDIQKSLGSTLDLGKSFEMFKEEQGKLELRTIPRKKVWSAWLKYAALLITVCTVGSWYFVKESEDNTARVSVDVSQEIKLELSDGSVTVITEGKKQQILNKQGELISSLGKNALSYTSKSPKKELLKETYHTLSIPFGRTFKLLLSDGTRVSLNAGSSLRYPTRFRKQGMRQVFLDGEGYFEVTKKEGQPFVVHTSTHNISVLGTKFNVSSYAEDNNMETVLVEGSVGIYSNNKTIQEKEMLLLKPQQKATWDPESKQISVVDTATDQYTAWVDGTLMFVNTPFLEMIRKIERHYNVSIQNNYTALDKFVFTATFSHENINQVMRAIQMYGHFDYTINNNKLIINQTLNQRATMKE